ncbi:MULTISPECIES: hypothetical protein [unclassified Streptomyces]|uniref:Uncharacterized protein n=1 Tax=Streptomyces sp. F12 TaxID=1436084 RepID=V9Z3Y1_9ACTN|nr:hypothetical protein [Streptomyces sp. F12]AHE40195.1 hypothetical protein pFRL6_108 [Streptomyces sp. F12]
MRPTATATIPRSRTAPARPSRRPPLCPLPDYSTVFREPVYTDPRVAEWYRQSWEEEQQQRVSRRRRPTP